MAGTADKRRCGSCGDSVGLDDVLCPHCDALLAAYEAPSGSDTGSSAALNPVDMSSTPAPTPLTTSPTSSPEDYVSPIPQSMHAQREAGTARDPSTATFTTPEFTAPAYNVPESSPIPQAVLEPRIAAEKSVIPLDTRAPGKPSTAIVENPKTAKPGSKPQAPASRQTNRKQERPPSQREDSRPAPEARGARAQPLPVASPAVQSIAVEHSREQHSKGLLPYPGMLISRALDRRGRWIVIVVLGIAFVRILVNSIGWTGLMFLIIAVLALVQWMRRLAKSTGRKTTNMPRDPWSRR